MAPIAQRINGALRPLPAWPLYPLGLLPAAWLWYLGLTGGLGVEPINALERALGEKALQLLILGLAVTPLRRFTGISLLRYRRAIGLLAFYYLCQHLGVWLFLDVAIPSQIWADIVKRPYVTIGMAGFLLLVPLALTSTDRALRLLGAARWQSLHRLVYFAVLAGGVHYLWLFKSKTWPAEPMAYLTVILVLLTLRAIPRRRRAAA